MLYLVIKATVSGVLIAAISEIGKRNPPIAALFASVPLVSILGMIWLWRDTSDKAIIADISQATFWLVLPSLPMFLLIPAMLRSGTSFWAALMTGCAVTVALYFLTVWILRRVGIAVL
jgi:hypothetical protein